VGAFVIGLRNPTPWLAVGLAVVGVAAALPSLSTLLPDGFLRARRGLPAILVCRVLATATFIGVDSFVPLAAARIHHAKPLVQGLVIVGAALTWTLGQTIMARRPPAQPRRAIAFGFALMVLGVALVSPVLWSHWPLWATFLSWPVGGLGIGMIFNPSTVAAMSYADVGREGMVSSQVHLSDSLGFSLMGGIGGAIVAVADRHGVDLRVALAVSFGCAAACALTGSVVAHRVVPRPRS
jgi:hypothetical protein